MKVLIIAAHPDDEVLGCGGTTVRLAKEGHDIYIAIMGEGITSRFPKKEKTNVDLIEKLHKSSRQASKLLGAKDIFFYNLPDNKFDTIPLLEIVKKIENLIKKIVPKTIYTHHIGDLNIDHQMVHRSVLTATRPTIDQKVQEIYTFEVPSSTEWAFQQINPVFQPNTFVDISETLEIKLKALSSYQSEIREFPHPRSPEAIRSIAWRWGSVSGCEAAEAFELIRAVKRRR